ncbi:MAG: XAC2610-related protein [Pyrinomonadaceae bacterium]
MVNFGDFNFDGSEDVAICDGSNGGYGMPSYQVFIYSTRLKKFVRSASFTKMNSGGLGMFEIDNRKKMLMVFSKSGCCWHRTEGFAVIGGRPKKVYEFTEDATRNQGKTVEITTRRLVNGKWRTAVKLAKTSEYYKN